MTNAAFTADRFGSANNAIWLSTGTISGYVQVPSGTYFNGGSFSVTVWVNLQSFTSSNSYAPVLMDFGTTTMRNANIRIGISSTGGGGNLNYNYYNSLNFAGSFGSCGGK